MLTRSWKHNSNQPENLIYRYFQIGFDTKQFFETADMVDLISDALEISFQKKGDKNIMTEDSSRAFLLSMIKKNTLVTKVIIEKKKFWKVFLSLIAY